MRDLVPVIVSSVMLTAACGQSVTRIPTSPTATNSTPPTATSFEPAVGGPRVGTVPLGLRPGPAVNIAVGEIARTNVDPAGLCIFDPQHACRRLSITVPSDGILEVLLTWDGSAFEFDPRRAGEVTIIGPNGGWVTSGPGHIENRAFMVVKSSQTYEVVVIAWEPAALPFELRTELRSN